MCILINEWIMYIFEPVKGKQFFLMSKTNPEFTTKHVLKKKEKEKSHPQVCFVHVRFIQCVCINRKRILWIWVKHEFWPKHMEEIRVHLHRWQSVLHDNAFHGRLDIYLVCVFFSKGVLYFQINSFETFVLPLLRFWPHLHVVEVLVEVW